MKRDFEYKGIKFHLNDNRVGVTKSNYEFFPKYKLLEYVEDCGKWMSCGCFDTKKEAVEYVKANW